MITYPSAASFDIDYITLRSSPRTTDPMLLFTETGIIILWSPRNLGNRAKVRMDQGGGTNTCTKEGPPPSFADFLLLSMESAIAAYCSNRPKTH